MRCNDPDAAAPGGDRPDLVTLVKTAKRPLPATLAKAAAAEETTALLDEVGALDFRELSADDVVG
ncbi:hypothetical protein OG912_33065 [Streptomyces sp. NBC_00464]|uniref:hypothetical protein n=1 Tax=Streptomyces sp. NBC_00464 TaxID=2975751 RepID=UPI002E17DFB2